MIRYFSSFSTAGAAFIKIWHSINQCSGCH